MVSYRPALRISVTCRFGNQAATTRTTPSGASNSRIELQERDLSCRVLIMTKGRQPESDRQVILSQQLPGFETMFLDGDDPADLARKPGEADFVVTPSSPPSIWPRRQS